VLGAVVGIVHLQVVTESEVPEILRAAWLGLGREDPITGCVETSAGVSTNRVYRLSLEGGRSAFAKVSSYGSYVHFRQDHARIHQWIELLQGGPYASFLAPVLLKNGQVYSFEDDGEWVVFYGEAPRRSVLPRVLTEFHIELLGREMARFHQASLAVSHDLAPTWQSLGSDLAALYDQMQSSAVYTARGLSKDHARLVRHHCDQFFSQSEKLGYHRLPKLPVLIDWNRGNFSVAYDEEGFELFSRWDYDWFRIEPRMMDFYFFCRVVREEGDQTVFHYTASPLLEARFVRFLRAYHQVAPLGENEVRFIKEAYRFFILNYVLRTGEHFFVPEICHRLSREAVIRYLPELDTLDLTPLVDALG
jgi:Ser/Thr protein kinase RdoA (MazF antagonist)